MKNINPKIEFLLREGYSILTLEKFNSNQIKLLYEKSKKSKKETKEETTSITKKYNLGDKTDKDKFLDASKSVSDKNKINFDPTTDTATVGEGEVTEKSLSKKQQQFFGIVRGMQKGDIPKKGDAGNKAKDMKKSDVLDFAKTKHKGLPNKKETKESQVKKIEENIMNLIEKHIYIEVSKKDVLKLLNKR